MIGGLKRHTISPLIGVSHFLTKRQPHARTFNQFSGTTPDYPSHRRLAIRVARPIICRLETDRQGEAPRNQKRQRCKPQRVALAVDQVWLELLNKLCHWLG